MSIPFQAALAGVLLAILVPVGASGAALESADFEGYPVVGNEALDALRGGFEMNIGGQLLSLAFSLERVSYLNGELLTRTRIEVPDIAAAILSPQTVVVSTYAVPPASGEASGNPAPRIGSASVPGPEGGSHVTLIQNGAGNSVALPDQLNQQVNQALAVAQAQVLQAYNHATVIQNSLDNQIIQNMTTLNVVLSNAALARAIELNAGLAQLLNGPLVLPQ